MTRGAKDKEDEMMQKSGAGEDERGGEEGKREGARRGEKGKGNKEGRRVDAVT